MNLMRHGKLAHHQQLSSPTMNSFYLIVLVTWCLYLLPSSSTACSCVYSHPQEHFCSADFVVSAKIQDDPKPLRTLSDDSNGYYRYPVKIKKVYRGINKTSVRKGFIYTGAPSDSCFPRLDKNTTYLITGRLIDGVPYTSLCNFISKWSALTVQQKKGFRRNFARACVACKVIDNESPFYGYNDENDSGELSNREGGQNFETNSRRSGTCHWQTKWDIEFDCQSNYSVCTPVSTIPDANSSSSQGFIESRESNDVSVNPHYNHHLNQNLQQNRSKLGQRCQWATNANYRYCMKNRAIHQQAFQHEREGEP